MKIETSLNNIYNFFFQISKHSENFECIFLETTFSETVYAVIWVKLWIFIQFYTDVLKCILYRSTVKFLWYNLTENNTIDQQICKSKG